MVSRSIILLCVILLSWSGASGQYSIRGVIKDSYGHPIKQVSVSCADLKKGDLTDDEGRFEINAVHAGNFIVRFTSVGYQDSVIPVTIVDHDLDLEVTMTNSVTELNEIIVTGISHASEIKKNPVPIETISAQSLTEKSATNLIDNIANKNGISQISTGVAISKPVIRGLGYNRVITLQDGIRQEGQQWGDEHGIEIDEFSVERVEIIKGAGSLLYGSDGIGGVINFLSPEPQPEGTLLAKLMSNYQGNMGLAATSLFQAGNIKGVYWNGRFTSKVAHAFQNKYDGLVYNSGFNERDYNATVGVTRNWGYSQITISSFDQRVGLVEGERDSTGHFTKLFNNNGVASSAQASDRDLRSYELAIPRQTINHFRLSTKSNIYFGRSNIQVIVGYQRNQRMEFGEVVKPTQRDLYFDLNTLNYNLTWFLPVISKWDVSVGTSGLWQQNENKGISFLIPEYKSHDLGVFVFMKRDFDRWTFAGGVRGDRRDLAIKGLSLDNDGHPVNSGGTEKFRPASLDFMNYSLSSGLSYSFNRIWNAKANISRGFRAPTIAELSSNGKHEGSLRYEYGNLQLKQETSWQVDVAVSAHGDHATFEAALFQNVIKRYIFTEKLRAHNGQDSIPDLSDPVPGYRYQQGTALLRGGELSLDIHPHPLDWLHIENNVSVVFGRNLSATSDSAKYLPFIPAPRYSGELRANLRRWKCFGDGFGKIEYQYFFQQNRVLLENRTETRAKSYQLVNVSFGTAVLSGSTTMFSLYLGVNNLFDQAYQNTTSRLRYAAANVQTGRTGVFNVGRNFFVKVVIPVTIRKAKS